MAWTQPGFPLKPNVTTTHLLYFLGRRKESIIRVQHLTMAMMSIGLKQCNVHITVEYQSWLFFWRWLEHLSLYRAILISHQPRHQPLAQPGNPPLAYTLKCVVFSRWMLCKLLEEEKYGISKISMAIWRRRRLKVIRRVADRLCWLWWNLNLKMTTWRMIRERMLLQCLRRRKHRDTWIDDLVELSVYWTLFITLLMMYIHRSSS